MTPDTPEPLTPAAPAGTDIDRDRRAMVLGGLGALPVLVAGCGGGADDSTGPTASAQQAPRVGLAEAATHYPALRKPTVGLLGTVPLTTPALRDAPATTAFWITIDAGTDARAVAAMAGTGGGVTRLELAVNPQQGTVLKLQADRAVRSVHVARAGQTGYVIGNGSQLSGATVARWDFDAADNIQHIEILAHPPVANTAGIEVECVGSALA
jgi:hypothetical protein